MTRRLLITCILTVAACLGVAAQGLPVFQNISAKEYHANKQNFDIDINKDGIVFVANFEGLLYYDNASWRIIHTPNISRITIIFNDSKGKTWIGGYNYFGYVSSDDNGNFILKTQDEKHEFKGEVNEIWEEHGDIYFSVSNGMIYAAKQNSIYKATLTKGSPFDYTSPVTEANINWQEPIAEGLTGIATDGDGLYVVDQNEHVVFHLNEENGLCSNNIQSLAYNRHGLLWGVTDNGIFVVELPSPYSRYTQENGLRGEVLSLAEMRGNYYAGTLAGVFRQKGLVFEQVNGMGHACWQLANQGESLLAATSNGVYRISESGTTQLTTASTTSILPDGDGIYCGELNGLYYKTPGKPSVQVSDAERVTKIIKDKNGVIWLQNLYGRIWNNASGTFTIQTTGTNQEEISTLVMYQNKPTIIAASAKEPFPYPLFSYCDQEGCLWLTNNQGKELYTLVNGSKNNQWTQMVYPLMDHAVRALVRDQNEVWMGGNSGLYVVNKSVKDPIKEVSQQLFIRSVVINDDSIAWGGFGTVPQNMVFEDYERQIRIDYSTDYPSLLLTTQYRYRINGGRWSAWDFDTFTEYNNQPYGRYTFEVQARDAYGRLSEIAKLSFEIKFPLYLRWYMLLSYGILLSVIGMLAVRWRIQQLRKDKIRLETVVRERTAEIVKQKDEIEEKSKSLETALSELGEAQHELVRQEKMATVGKLTQGLIDRILNPLNYINNFSKLSEGLVNDVKANIEDEKDHMDPENYEDTIDVLDMLKGNLQKVGEHGANTTRTLKAMEEVMKDRTSGITKIDLIPLVKKDEEMLNSYYEKDITTNHIKCVFDYPPTSIYIKANAEILSTTFMSLLNNALYAVKKKVKKQNYSPEIHFTMTSQDDKVLIKIRDNGIGIEETIINKIFDPFFTTKTTGEASGVGLYLSREVVQNYGGDISVASQKDEFTEFTISLPTTK